MIAISGFFAARLAETSTSARNITKGYLVSALFFLMFSIVNGLWPMIILQGVLISSILFAINRDRITRVLANTLRSRLT